MHKNKAIAAALLVTGTAAGAAHAQGSTTLYGVLDVHVATIDQKGAGYAAADRSRITGVNSNGSQTSFFGIAGREALGNGLTAVYTIEGFLRPDTGEGGRFGTTDVLFKREASVGLTGGFGRVVAGRMGTHYFNSALSTNPFFAAFGFGPSMMHTFATGLGAGLGIRDARTSYIRNDSGWSNAIAYTTPTLSGFTGSAMYSFASGSNDQETTNKRGKSWSVQANYRGGPLTFSGTYQDIDVDAVAQRQKAWIVGAVYDLGLARVSAQYQSIKSAVAAGQDEDRGWQLGATVPFGAHNLLASYFRTDTEDTAGRLPDKVRKTWAVGYRYDFSRRTDGYVVYMDDTLQTALDKDRTLLALGMRHRF